jgi:hypothetical protein
MRMEGNMGGRWWRGMKGELLGNFRNFFILIYHWLKAPFLGLITNIVCHVGWYLGFNFN